MNSECIVTIKRIDPPKEPGKYETSTTLYEQRIVLDDARVWDIICAVNTGDTAL